MRGLLTSKLKEYSATLVQQGLHRRRRVNTTNNGIINFSSSDYLSLTSDTRIKNAYQAGFERYPTGSGGSMVVCGYHATHNALEKAFADALNVDDCILFSSGYAANLSVTGLLARFDTHILIDKSVHASTYDGLQLSRASYSRYLHNNVVDLAAKIKTICSPLNTPTPTSRGLSAGSRNLAASLDPANKPRDVDQLAIITEGTFSMSGQCAPLNEIAQLGHDLIVDEAHAFGILGHQGLGSVVHHQLTQAEIPLRVIPLGKAYGASGAIVAGQGAWIDALLQSARPQTYSTAISPAVAYGLLETLEVLRGADDRRKKLAELIKYFRAAINNSPLKWRDSQSPIQQLQLGCPHRAQHFADKLLEHSILCLPMRQPTVSKQETGLRVILNYHHEPEHIDRLFEFLHQSRLGPWPNTARSATKHDIS